MRRNILLQTTNNVFGLSAEQSDIDDSLSAVIYYVHVLGDHTDEEDYNKRASDMIEVGGRSDNHDIIHHLIDHFEVLFPKFAKHQ